MSDKLLTLENVRVELRINGQLRPVVHDVSLAIGPGEAVGLVGESGSGKSMTAKAIMRLLPGGARVSGELQFDGSPIPQDAKQLRRWRSTEVAMIFQDPRAHINPVRTIGDFLTEALVANRGVPRPGAEDRAVTALRAVGISDAPRRLRQRPHELSGGLLQRVMIASTLLIEPRLLLADEPTTALDVTTQEEVMAILEELRRDRGLSLLFITHDLELAAAVCDRTAVMYAGFLVEEHRSATLGQDAGHPYSRALLRSRPGLEHTGGDLAAIPGRPLSGPEAPDGCAFAERCERAEPICQAERPALRPIPGGHAACHFADEISRQPAHREQTHA